MSQPSELVRRVLASAAGDAGDVRLHFVDHAGVEDSTTVAQLVDDAFALAGGLAGAGVRPGDVVAVRGSGSRRFGAGVLACALGGMVAVPLVSLLGDGDVDLILDLSGARALLSETTGTRHDLVPHLTALAGTRPELLVVDLDDRDAVRGAVRLEPGAGEHQPVALPGPAGFVLFTSGTTSVPKGAVHSHDTVLAEVLDFAGQLDLLHGGRFLQPFPMGHVGGLVGLFLALALGREVVVLASWNAAVAFEAIERHALTSTGSTPYFAATLFEERARRGCGLASLTTMESGGGPVGSDLVRRAHEIGIALSPGYGSTEHPTVATHRSSDPLEVRAGSDGRPTNGSEIRIVGADGGELPVGGDGEVVVRGPEQFLGYLSGDRSAFLDGGWFRTGDLGHLTADGCLRVTGRLKEIIIRGGENISVPEVEAHLAAHPDVLDAAVVGLPDVRFGERASAFVVRRPGHPVVDLDSVRHHFVARGVARFKIPESVHEVAELPRNALGKVQRHALVPVPQAGSVHG
ncbi:MAG TPA: AMP-binding protein [Streptosporangiaceae bacterium]|nr:AMP-binding protein [Streptosporangiaceae bacterium]